MMAIRTDVREADGEPTLARAAGPEGAAPGRIASSGAAGPDAEARGVVTGRRGAPQRGAGRPAAAAAPRGRLAGPAAPLRAPVQRAGAENSGRAVASDRPSRALSVIRSMPRMTASTQEGPGRMTGAFVVRLELWT